MMGLERKPLRRNVFANGAPRHYYVRCTSTEGCTFRGTRTADKPEDIPLGRKCPKCGSTVEAAAA